MRNILIALLITVTTLLSQTLELPDSKLGVVSTATYYEVEQAYLYTYTFDKKRIYTFL
jgi:hypothetical protein